ncbi:hypothetical protein [Paenibacillus harenae]|uniref:hypothetical protein n=1 Tax=Paenibacillus harenae TaxID=306543 RepID=UPI00048F8E4C|nr:hypothetical protein [Paenibacillus harenae]
MVDHIVKVASILSQPDLEEDTKKAINQYIRDNIRTKPVTTTAGTLDPFNPVRAQAESLLGVNLVSEWMDGPTKEGDK